MWKHWWASFGWRALELSRFMVRGSVLAFSGQWTSARVPVFKVQSHPILWFRVQLDTWCTMDTWCMRWAVSVTQELYSLPICLMGTESVLSWPVWFLCCFIIVSVIYLYSVGICIINIKFSSKCLILSSHDVYSYIESLFLDFRRKGLGCFIINYYY